MTTTLWSGLFAQFLQGCGTARESHVVDSGATLGSRQRYWVAVMIPARIIARPPRRPSCSCLRQRVGVVDEDQQRPDAEEAEHQDRDPDRADLDLAGDGGRVAPGGREAADFDISVGPPRGVVRPPCTRRLAGFAMGAEVIASRPAGIPAGPGLGRGYPRPQLMGARCPRHRQLRLVHVQPRSVLGRAGSRAARPPPRRAHARTDRRARAGCSRDLARPGDARRRWSVDGGDQDLRAAGARCSACASVTSASAKSSAAASFVPRRSCTARRHSSATTAAGVFSSLPDPLEATRYHSLVVDRDVGPDRTRDHGRDRRRHGHGTAPPGAPDRGRAVPPRVDPDVVRPRPAPELPRPVVDPRLTARVALTRSVTSSAGCCCSTRTTMTTTRTTTSVVDRSTRRWSRSSPC